MTSEQREREGFEAQWPNKSMLEGYAPHGKWEYYNRNVQLAWEIWLARAEIAEKSLDAFPYLLLRYIVKGEPQEHDDPKHACKIVIDKLHAKMKQIEGIPCYREYACMPPCSDLPRHIPPCPICKLRGRE